jgi:hypothetical protein
MYSPLVHNSQEFILQLNCYEMLNEESVVIFIHSLFRTLSVSMGDDEIKASHLLFLLSSEKK